MIQTEIRKNKNIVIINVIINIKRFKDWAALLKKKLMQTRITK